MSASTTPTPGDVLRAARLREGYSQHQLAALLNITPPIVVHWERGHRNIPDYRRAQLAVLLHCPALAADVAITPSGVARRLAAIDDARTARSEGQHARWTAQWHRSEPRS